MSAFETIDDAVSQFRDQAISFAGRLIATPSVVGDEMAAQEIVASELDRLGFDVARIPIPEAIESVSGSGVPQASYEGRYVVAGRRPGRGRSLLINGHVDVVPAGDSTAWLTHPFVPAIEDGWLRGRGAGDMKGGIAMATLAIEAMLEAEPLAVTGGLSVVSVIEEECTGNGTLAAAHAGVLADAVLIPEPTNLSLLLDGVGVLWAEIVVSGLSTHAQRPGRGRSAIDCTRHLLTVLDGFQRELTVGGRIYALNIGTLYSGDWQSTVPATARLGIRMGFPAEWSIREAEERIRDAISTAAEHEAWLCTNPPHLRLNGFRAEGYAQSVNTPLVHLIRNSHRDVIGTEPEVIVGSATTDARFYVNQFGTPAVCYGPTARNIHGPNEAVEIASIETGARVLARVMARWLAA